MITNAASRAAADASRARVRAAVHPAAGACEIA
jgi:hypothetical protein